jgi:pterin-4a-carbinolamine dehydratase
MTIAFINYRRSDTAQAAQGLHTQLRARFGPTHVYLDVNAILPGALWQDRLRDMLSESTVLLSVIGPRWLTAANEYGQRRLDDNDDWVRNEIAYAIEHQKPIIPLLVAGAEALPPRKALPPDIQGLLDHQAWKLRDEKWDRDLAELIDLLESLHGFVDHHTTVPLPPPEVEIPALSASELDHALSNLPGWQPVESTVPRDYPKLRQELRKVFRFKSFKSAVEFMQAAVPKINKMQHHPRWENQWRSVTVYLSTWDIGNRISNLDVQLAKELDALYQRLK